MISLSVSTFVNLLSDWPPGDGSGRKLPHHLPHRDGGAEGAPGQRHGRAGGLRLRPSAQLEADGQ